MKIMCFIVVGVLASAGVLACSPVATSAPAHESANTNPWSDEETTEVVVTFYNILLQEEAPTLQQEEELFSDFAARSRLIAKSTEKDAENQPLVLNWCRRNKELFLPVNMKTPGQVLISSPFVFARSLDRVRDKTMIDCYVMVLLADRTEPARLRTIIFPLGRNGKICPDGITFDSLDGPLLYEKIIEDIGWKPRFNPETHAEWDEQEDNDVAK
jgi:hypothetical protein